MNLYITLRCCVSMHEYDLDFSPLSSDEYGTYKLIELTPDLTSSIEGALRDNNGFRSQSAFSFSTKFSVFFRLTIKGHSNDNAVLCTTNRTFAMRSIVLSNTVLVVTPVPDEHVDNFADNVVVIRDQLNEIIELIPIFPRLHGLFTLIRDQQYDEGDDDDETQKDMNQVCRLKMLR